MMLNINKAADRLYNLMIHDMHSNADNSHTVTELVSRLVLRKGKEFYDFILKKKTDKTDKTEKILVVDVYDEEDPLFFSVRNAYACYS